MPFRSERDKNSFALVIVHKDEMENNDLPPKVNTPDVNENKKAKPATVGWTCTSML